MEKRSVQEVAEVVMDQHDQRDLRVRNVLNDKGSGPSQIVLVVTEFPPGKSHLLHRHPYCDQVAYVLNGTMLHLSREGSERVTEGDVQFIEKGEWHGYKNDTDESATIIVIFGGIGSLEEAGYELAENS